MELFQRAKLVRLKSHHGKFLYADEDEESVKQDRNGSSENVKWAVEFIGDDGLRLKSCYNRYSTASNQPFLLGMTGRKVLQTTPRRMDSSVEWVPKRDGFLVKIKTRYGNFLRANGVLPPWKDTITHDVPQRTVTQDWILWEVEVLDIVLQPIEPPEPESPIPKGRTINFLIADDNGNTAKNPSSDRLIFNGTSLKELIQKLEERTGIDDLIVCSRISGRLIRLHLQLPPNNTSMNIILVRPSSRLARSLQAIQ